MNPKSVNVVLWAVWLFTLGMWLIGWIGRLRTIAWLYNTALVDVPGVSINWPAIYFFGWVLSGAFLAATNWERISERFHKLIHRRKGDLPVNVAVLRMVTTAQIAEAWPPPNAARFPNAIRTLQRAFSDGRIYVMGRKNCLPPLVKIERDAWEVGELFFVPTGNVGVSTWVSEKGKPSVVRFDSLMLDSEDFEREFPSGSLLME